MLTEQDYYTLDAMEKHGGSFVKALANLARHADSKNIEIVKETWSEYWAQYETCEALMDIANNFQFWRFHHLKTVERIIGHKPGTGGSSGVSFLKKAIDSEFFPELIRVRTEIGT